MRHRKITWLTVSSEMQVQGRHLREISLSSREGQQIQNLFLMRLLASACCFQHWRNWSGLPASERSISLRTYYLLSVFFPLFIIVFFSSCFLFLCIFLLFFLYFPSLPWLYLSLYIFSLLPFSLCFVPSFCFPRPLFHSTDLFNLNFAYVTPVTQNL